MYLTFDIGGTNTRIASSKDGESLYKVETQPTNLDFQEALKEFKDLALKVTDGEKVDKAAGGVRALDFSKLKLINHPNFPMWVDLPLRNSLEEILSCPVYLENDAAMAALGEASMGAGKNYKIVAYITIGTGVGGARIIDKKIDQTNFGFEPGQQIIEISCDQYPYNDGTQYLENIISGNALEKRFKKKPDQLTNPAVWSDVGKYLAFGLNNVIVLWSPSIIVLGGGMVSLIPLDAVQFHLKQVFKIFPEIPDITVAKLGDQAGLLGSLEYLKSKM